VEYALKCQTITPISISDRKKITSYLYELAELLRSEDDEFIRLAPPEVSAVLKAYCVKRVAFMREVVHICCPDDYAAALSTIVPCQCVASRALALISNRFLV